MASSKFSCGEVVWCKSPASSNVWPAKICSDKNSGQWQQNGKIFLQFYGQVKCQAGKWIAQANVVAFKDITDLGKSPQPSLVAAFKQAQEDFNKTSKERKGSGDLTITNGGGLAPSSSKPVGKPVQPKVTEPAGASSPKPASAGTPVQKAKTDAKDAKTKEKSGNSSALDASKAVQSKTAGKPSFGAALVMKREQAQKTKSALNHRKAEDSPGSRATKGGTKRSLASIMKDLVPSPEKKRAKVDHCSGGSSGSDFGSEWRPDRRPPLARASESDSSNSGDEKESNLKLNKCSSTAQEKSKKDAAALSGKKTNKKSGENKENSSPNLKTAKKKANDQAKKVKETVTASLEKYKKQESKTSAPSGSTEAPAAPGSSLSVCHQCGLASSEPKSKCRSRVCPGIRGQFCKMCLLQHYNQDIDAVLKDAIWQCPPCRGTCTCSTCKTPVGRDNKQILSQLALNRGHQTVRSYLEHLIKNIADESS